MKFKTTILMAVTARGRFCHSQCRGIVDINPGGFCCSIFSMHLEIENGKSVRDKKCLSAERAAARYSQCNIGI